MEEQKESSGGSGCLKWVMIGCGVALLLGILGGVGVFFVVRMGVREAKSEVARQFEVAISDAESVGSLSDADLTLLRNLLDIAQNEDASIVAVTVCASVSMDVLGDDEISDEERDDLNEVFDYFGPSKGDMGFIEATEFISQHPEYQNSFDALSDI